ncbi:MAG: phosphoribosylformylglycinamidine cyclo-ligase [Ignavibacteria bacterium RIFOXYC2_FULL_35_21]|nr:MAG: phosphoribosylformylglycinamidine cyclo-ligase [Ignavibacteria bacterium GWA2_35_8]OGU96244.1 MAG: phosphoribosylformylglycinamidine cyclo-ligase [Ignavibacteria bacterium RIFOXYA2_FULL_35_10]OGV21467.1 MAG: phosphoribosylformylglycinamidine cyclo-ligase [Ignavibacteria bacterium RIFOXYC2_FULL_35_21]
MKTYKDSGVDIEAGDETIRRIKPLVKSTFNKNVLADIGLFGGFYEANFPEYEHPVLVASTDGVGTKLKIAFMTGVHDTVGQCLVNHGVNDILSCGAKPLFFLDYFATGKLEPTVAEQVISGFVKACRENGCALIGGETAEMPSMYQEGEYDVSGTIIGVVEKSKIVNGKNIIPGDVLIGLPSTGLHTNGYSLARAVLLEKYPVTQYFDELGCTLGEALLKVHHSYLHVVTPLLETGFIKGISHITGGGIIGNTKRILPEGTSLNIDWNSWETLPIFKLIQKEGNISDEEMRLTFNLGIGMLLVVDKSNVAQILSLCEKEKPVLIGRIKN